METNYSAIRALKEESFAPEGEKILLKDLLTQEESALFFLFEEKDGILTLGPVVFTPSDFEDSDFSNFAFCEMRELAEKMDINYSEGLERPCGCTYAGVIPADKGQRTRTLLFA